MFAHLSYRVRLPLSLVATALFTTLVICLLMAWHTYRNVRIELVDNGSRLGYAVANAVQPALLHDDIWLAYSILRGPRSIQGNLDATLIVLDDERKIFASNKPRLLPVAVPLQEADPVLAKMLPADDKGPGGGELVDLDSLPDRLLLVSPIASDGVTVGLLLLVYPRQVLWPRFAAIVKQGGCRCYWCWRSLSHWAGFGGSEWSILWLAWLTAWYEFGTRLQKTSSAAWRRETTKSGVSMPVFASCWGGCAKRRNWSAKWSPASGWPQ